MNFVEATREELAELFLGFSSLGANCEFGLVQDRAGVNPLGLFRFGASPIEAVTAALKARFEGVGAAEHLQVFLEGDHPEFLTRDSRFGFYLHSRMYLGQHEPAEVISQECRRFSLLARMLADDLTEGSKIFVVKQGLVPLRAAPVFRLADAVRGFGPGLVLWVTLADEAHPPGHVEHIHENLLHGYVDRFAPTENAGEFSFSAWVAVCRAARELASEGV